MTLSYFLTPYYFFNIFFRRSFYSLCDIILLNEKMGLDTSMYNLKKFDSMDSAERRMKY